MDDFILPDDKTFEKLAEEYGKLKLENARVDALAIPTKRTILTHIGKEDGEKLPDAAQEIYLMQRALLSLTRGLLSRTYSEDVTEALVATLTLKRKANEKCGSLLDPEKALPDKGGEIPSNMPFKMLGKRLVLKQLQLLRSLSQLNDCAFCNQTKRLIREIKSDEIYALFHIYAILL